MVHQNRSYIALHTSQRQESNGKPAKVSGDKTVNFIKLFIDIFSQLHPGNGTRNACWRFLCPIEYVFRKRTESTIVELCLGVFQGIVNFHREALWSKEYQMNK
jgi:hypothetical protein